MSAHSRGKKLNQAGLSAAAPSKPSAKVLRAAEGIWGGEVEVSVIYESESEERRAPRATGADAA